MREFVRGLLDVGKSILLGVTFVVAVIGGFTLLFVGLVYSDLVRYAVAGGVVAFAGYMLGEALRGRL